MIVTKPNVEWGFQCTYDTEYEIGESLTVNAAAISQGFSQTNAQFAFSFDFYTDGTFTDIQDTATYLVGQRLNFGGIYPYFDTRKLFPLLNPRIRHPSVYAKTLKNLF